MKLFLKDYTNRRWKMDVESYARYKVLKDKTERVLSKNPESEGARKMLDHVNTRMEELQSTWPHHKLDG